MFAAIKDALGTTRLEGTGRGGGGCINEGEVFKTDAGKIFLKKNSKSKAREMFDGEYKSLKAIVAAGIVKAPTPLLVVDNPAGGAVLVMEYLDMHSLNRHSGTLGSQLAKLHLLNVEVGKKCQANESYVGQTSEEDNPTYEFYTKKLQLQLSWIEKEYGDREARELWSHLQLKIPQYFSGIEVKPSLLHGDLWGGNAAETAECPVIFDPASFYGHHEYDLAISAMFGGFSRRFWDEYHSIIPKAPGWNNRHKLYKLFHNLNHWSQSWFELWTLSTFPEENCRCNLVLGGSSVAVNHFGSGYRSGSLQLMRDLCR